MITGDMSGYTDEPNSKNVESGTVDANTTAVNVDSNDVYGQNGDEASDDHAEDVNNKEKGKKPGWTGLLSEYGAQTTMHGVRYICAPESISCRRYTWLILIAFACVLLTYLITEKVLYLRTEPKSVNVDFSYNATLRFPAVTICNESPYKLSSMHKLDLYDLMVLDRGKDNVNTSEPGETYWLYAGVCGIPSSTPYQRTLNEVSRSVCREVCSSVYSDQCSGFLYRRSTRSCTLSPYTAEPIRNPDCDLRLAEVDLEFYRRSRLLKYSEVLVNFEDGTIGLLRTDWSRREHWTVAAATAHKWDVSIYLPGKGHYAIMSETKDRSGYEASMKTPFLNTTGKCMELFYWITQVADIDNLLTEAETHISIIATSEEHEDYEINRLVAWDYSDFQRMYLRLPDGIHQIAIVGKRTPDDVESCISVDELSIMDCSKFEEEAECLTSPRGFYYLGKRDTSRSGKRCLPWEQGDDGPVDFSKYLPDVRPEDAANYCRFLPHQNWTEPSCLVRHEMDIIIIEPCSISYCGATRAGCRQSSSRNSHGHGSRQCANGMCLPDSLQCTGVSYCTDGSTIETFCSNKSSLSCDFEDPFVCGYTTTTVNEVSWERVDRNGLNQSESDDKTGEEFTLFKWQSMLEQMVVHCVQKPHNLGGYVMRVNSFGRYGDRIALTSPKPPEHEQADDGKKKILEFQYYIVEEAANTGGSLEVYVLSEEKVPIVKLMRKEDNTYNTWITEKCPLPTEKLVYIMFVATLGLPFTSDVMIDNVLIKADDESSLGKQLGGHTTTTTTRAFNVLGLKPAAMRKTTTYIVASQTFEVTKGYNGVARDASNACGQQQFHSENGVIVSPYYPSNYPGNLNCTYYIHSPEGGRVVINFTAIDIEISESNGQCFDYVEIKCMQKGQRGTAKRSEPGRKFCGQVRPEVMTFNCTTTLVTFYSDAVYSKSGFRLQFKVIMPDVIYAAQNWALTVYYAATTSHTEHYADIYYAVDSIQQTAACLKVNFTAYSYLSIKLVYVTNDVDRDYKEELIYRIVNPARVNTSHWQATIEPSENRRGEKFYIVIHMKTSRPGVMAIIRAVQMTSKPCTKSGDNHAGSYLHEFCSRRPHFISGTFITDCIKLQEETSKKRKRWFAVDAPNSSKELRCEFEAGNEEDRETRLISSVVNSDGEKSILYFWYDISSPEIHVNLQLVQKHNFHNSLFKSRLSADSNLFRFDDSSIADEYQILISAFRLSHAGGSTNEFFKISNVNRGLVHVQGGSTNHVESGINCQFLTASICGYVIGERWQHTDDGDGALLYKSNGNNNSAINQLTTPMVHVHSKTNHVAIDYLAESDHKLSVFIANEFGNIRYPPIHEILLPRNQSAEIGFCMPTGKYRIAFVVTSRQQSLLQIKGVVLSQNTSPCGPIPKLNGLNVASFSVLSPQLSWSCQLRQSRHFHSVSSNDAVFIRYNMRGKFSFHQLRKRLQSARQFVAYVIWEENSFVQINVTGRPCDAAFLHINTRLSSGLYDRQSFPCCNLSNTFNSSNGVFHLVVPRKVLQTCHINHISYGVVQQTTRCNGGKQVLEGVIDRNSEGKKYFAEWSSPVITPARNQTQGCFSYDIWTHKTNSISAKLFYLKTTSAVVYTRNLVGKPINWRTRDAVDMQLHNILRYQIVVSFETNDNIINRNKHSDYDDYANVIAVINEMRILLQPCQELKDYHYKSKTTTGKEETQLRISIATSTEIHWRPVHVPSGETTAGQSVTNRTLSGRQCQRWDSLHPHTHPYVAVRDGVSENFCGSPDGDMNAWCYTTDPDQPMEHCDANAPDADWNAVAVLFDSNLATASFQFDVPTNKNWKCVTMKAQVNSPSVRLLMGLTTGNTRRTTDLEVLKLANSSERFSLSFPVDRRWKLSLAADKYRFTRETDLVVATLRIESLDEDYCKSADGGVSFKEIYKPPSPKRLPLSAYKKKIFNSMRGNDMTNLTMELSHKIRSHFITGCRFGAQRCSDDMFQPVLTEMGVCYTFNNDPTKQFLSNVSGIQLGLWLTINLEQYENIKWYGEEAGVKIALHEPGDVGVEDYGLGVSPGVRALFELKYSESHSLPAPYGKCDDNQQLRYFGENQTYSVAKCQLECQTDLLRKQCSCQQPHMSGPFKTCDLEEFMTCVFPWKSSSAARDYSNCTCAPSCINVDYDATVSSSHLSELLYDSELNGPHGDAIRKRYRHAQEIRSRVDNKVFPEVVGGLERLLDSLNRFKTVVEVDVYRDQTSVTRTLLNAITALIQETSKSMATYQAKILNEAATECLQQADEKVNSVIDAAKSLDDAVEKLCESLNCTSLETDAEYTLLSTNWTIEMLTTVRVVTTSLRKLLQRGVVIKRQLATISFGYSQTCCLSVPDVNECGNCDLEADDLERLLRQGIDDNSGDEADGSGSGSGSSDNATELTFDVVFPVVKSLRPTLLKAIALSKRPVLADALCCQSKLNKLESDVQSWYDNEVINSSLPFSITTTSIGELNVIMAWLARSINLFSTGKLSQANLSAEFLKDEHVYATMLNTLSSNVPRAVESTIEDVVNDYKKRITEALQTMITLSGRFGELCNKVELMETHTSVIEKFARSLFIWRKPYPKFQHSEDLGFQVKKHDVKRIWPDSQSIVEFSRLDAATTIKLNIEEFFSYIPPELSKLASKLRREISSAVGELHYLGDLLHEYNKSMEITGDFVQKNFLKLRLFYGDIKYNVVSQSRAYDIISLLGDLGGYLGLLVGGSVLTLIEVVDLVFYNALLKLLGRRKTNADAV